MTNFYETVLTVLKSDERFIAEDGTFLRNAVYEAAMKMDTQLIRLLLANDETRTRFFTDVDGVKVFDKIGFAWVINNRQFLPDSYTRFKNKIGLADETGALISASDKVELVFPYKDCILEGGQTKNEPDRKEVFYNESLAPGEVDRLLMPKVLRGAKRYTTDGIEDTLEFHDDDNLVIRGNNLLALSSLLKVFEGRVKCIYIDPPYYFNVKKKDIFGVENFINKITVKTKSPSGFASVNPGVFETAEYILGFAKNKCAWRYNPQYVESGYDENYKYVVVNKEAPASEWIIRNIIDVLAEKHGYHEPKAMRDELGKPVVDEMVAQFAFEHADSVFQSVAIGNNAGQAVVEARDQSKKQPERILTVEREGQYTVYVYKGREIAFYSKKLHEVDGELVPSMQVSNIWTDTPYEGIASEGGVTLKGGKKPEKLIRRLLEMASNPGDIVLDYHLGSGTTCAVAHKIGRRYIGVEQLEYDDNDSTVRLESVINGDTTGISKAVKWQGGGSFVYCELAKLNQTIVEEIEAATDEATLSDIYGRMVKSGFISYKVNPADIDAAADDYGALALDDKKRFLMEILDKNLLYVNYCDIDDEEFCISDEDKAFTRSFYREG